MTSRWCLAALLVTLACGGTSAPPPATMTTTELTNSSSALPEILVATQGWDYNLVLAHVHAHRVDIEVVAKGTRHDYAQFGWLDPRTLVFHELTEGERSRVRTFANGTATTQLELDERWHLARLLVTTHGEAWVARCTDDDCTRSEYQRAVPAPHIVSTARPADIDERRVGVGGTTRGAHRAVAELAAPAGMTIERVQLAGNTTGVRCTSGGRATTYPEAPSADQTYRATAARWVLAAPAVYEVSATVETAITEARPVVDYFIACRPTPLAGFISFGDGRWAEYVEAADHEDGGAWVFRAGTTEIGRYAHGPGQVRSNQVPEPTASR